MFFALAETFARVCAAIYLYSVYYFQVCIYAQLPLPRCLVALDSEHGQALLQQTEYKKPFKALSAQQITQKNSGFCGIASAVMIYNAIKATEYDDATSDLMSQDSIFTHAVLSIVTPDQLLQHGITLQKLSKVLDAHGLRNKAYTANKIDISQFRTLVG